MNHTISAGRTKLLQRILNRWQLYLFLLPPLAYIFIFAYVPIGGLTIAFNEFDLRYGIFASEWVGFENFTRFLSSYQFERVLKNTLSVSFYSLFAGFPLPILFALFLNAIPFSKYRKTVQTITYMPHFISVVVLVGIIMQIFNVRSGFYGTMYRAMVGPEVPDLLGIANAFPHMYVWSGIWQGLGWNSIIYFSVLSSIDPTLHEAAQIDGATRVQQLWHIELPHLLPTASILLILSAGGIMNVGFEKVLLMQNELNLRTSEVISTYVYKVGLVTGGGDFSFATAIGMFNSVINFALLVTVNLITRKLGGSSLW